MHMGFLEAGPTSGKPCVLGSIHAHVPNHVLNTRSAFRPGKPFKSKRADKNKRKRGSRNLDRSLRRQSFFETGGFGGVAFRV